jgi:UDP-glucose 6-dehydrogenase
MLRRVFIAVGTPSRRGDGHADLTFVYDAVREVALHLSTTAVVITKSTVPVGTGDEIENILRAKRPDAEIQVVSNPEFLREGAAIQDFKHPDRIVIGSDEAHAQAVLAEIYRPLYLNTPPIRLVETVSAVNEQRKRAMARKVVAALDGSIRGKTIADAKLFIRSWRWRGFFSATETLPVNPRLEVAPQRAPRSNLGACAIDPLTRLRSWLEVVIQAKFSGVDAVEFMIETKGGPHGIGTA